MVTTSTAYLALLGFVVVERLFELALSSRNARLAFAEGAIEVGQGHFRVMSAMHTLFLVACGAEVLLLDRPFVPILGIPALIGSVLAQALRYWAVSTLGRRWNVRIIVLPDAQPVTSGPYRWVRHPNYVAVILEILCLPLVHTAWITALVFTAANAAVLVVRIRAEEEALGARYAAEFAHSPRFMPWSKR